MYPTRMTPFVGSKVKDLNFAIAKSVVNISTENLHADRNNRYEIVVSRPGSDPLGGLEGFGGGQKSTFFRIWLCCISGAFSQHFGNMS